MRIRNAAQGFTMMEVLMVIMIISIMYSVVVPSYSNYQATEMSFAAASNLTSDVRMARFRSIEHQCYCRVRFSSVGDGWFVEELYNSGTGEPIDGEPTIPPSDFEWRSFIGPDMREVHPAILLQFAPNPPPDLFFRPDGVMVSGPRFDAPPVGVTKVSFVYDNMEDAQGAEVLLTPAGVIESRAFYREDY